MTIYPANKHGDQQTRKTYGSIQTRRMWSEATSFSPINIRIWPITLGFREETKGLQTPLDMRIFTSYTGRTEGSNPGLADVFR